MATKPVRTVDLFDTLRGDYTRPRCDVCGRLAGRDSDGWTWRFKCVGEYNPETKRWDHD